MKRALLVALVGCSGGAQKPPTSSGPLPPNDPVTTAPSEPGSVAPEGAERAKVHVVLPTARAWSDAIATLWDRGAFVRWQTATPHTHTTASHAIHIASGTYTFQPAGIAHVEPCDDKECVHLVHSPEGPVDVVAAKAATKDPGSVMVRLSDAKFSPLDANDPGGAAIAPVWGDMKAAHGVYLKLPAGSKPMWRIHKHDFHAVVLRGTVQHYQSGSAGTDLPAGTYIHQAGGYKHTTTCSPGAECILYVFHTGAYDVKPG